MLPPGALRDETVYVTTDGRVVGPDDKDLGTVGSVTAALPGERVAWLGILPDGQVQSYGGHDIRQGLRAHGSARVGHHRAGRARILRRPPEPPVAI